MIVELPYAKSASRTSDGNLTSDSVKGVTGITLDAEAACEAVIRDGDASGTILDNISAAISTSQPVEYSHPLSVTTGKVYVQIAGSGRLIVHYLKR